MVVGDLVIVSTTEKIYGQRESNLEGIKNKIVRVIFLPKFSTLQLRGNIGM